MSGYWRRPEDDERVFEHDPQGRVWLRSGDIGRIDADGFLYFVQRSGRTCSIDGESVMPGLTEMVLCEHDAVREAVVIGDERGGESVLVAHVVALDNDLDLEYLENELRLVCAQQLGRALQPERYEFHERLPLTPTGVVDYRRVGA
jgi:acyl-CoA synthetase (AMP-forming)/AMP-acid ligase II